MKAINIERNTEDKDIELVKEYQHQELSNEDYFECMNDYYDGMMNV